MPDAKPENDTDGMDSDEPSLHRRGVGGRLERTSYDELRAERSYAITEQAAKPRRPRSRRSRRLLAVAVAAAIASGAVTTWLLFDDGGARGTPKIAARVEESKTSLAESTPETATAMVTAAPDRANAATTPTRVRKIASSQPDPWGWKR